MAFLVGPAQSLLDAMACETAAAAMNVRDVDRLVTDEVGLMIPLARHGMVVVRGTEGKSTFDLERSSGRADQDLFLGGPRPTWASIDLTQRLSTTGVAVAN